MSAGAFVTRNYQSETTGSNHPIRVQPETLNMSLDGIPNFPLAEPAAVLPSATVSQGRRTSGINARTITVKFTAANAPDGYKPDSPITIPWLQNNAAFLSAVPGVTPVSYLGNPAVLVGKNPEIVR
jgi:hypothetical protein